LAVAYNNRGFSKDDLKDYYGAIADYTKAIELDPNYASAYKNRAIAKYYTNDLNGACEDARKSGSLGNPFPKMIEAACN
jgi:lipoprotein NlpI